MEDFKISSANSPECLKKIYGQAGCVLNRLKPSIRILTLHAGQEDQPIRCTLQPVLLDETDIRYEALSYAWGDPANVSPVSVDGEEFNITVNLKDFLQSLRLPSRVRYLWADAICIDQSSHEERISHLELMGRLYRDALQVRIWLGRLESSWDAELAVDKAEKYKWASFVGDDSGAERLKEQLSKSVRRSFDKAPIPPPHLDAEFEDITDPESPLEQARLLLEALADNAHLHHLPFYGLKADRLTPCTDTEGYIGEGEDAIDADKLKSVENLEFNMEWLQVVRLLLWLLSRPWWYRVWTLQELVLPYADPTFHVDKWTIPASCFLSAIARISDHQQNCCKPFDSIWAGNYSQTIKRLACRIQDFNSLRREAQDQDHIKLSPLSPIFLSSDRQTSDIRDHVYGILGLMEPGFALICQQKAYRQTAIDLFIRSSRLMMCGTGSLKTLALASANGSRKGRLRGLPSWAVDFRHTMKNHDPLCEGEPRIEACLGKPFDSEDLLYEPDNPTLLIKGIWVGTVSECVLDRHGMNDDSKLSASEIRSRIEVSLDRYETTIYKDRGTWMTPDDEKRYWRTVMRSSWLDEPQEETSPGAPTVSTDMIQRWWAEFSANKLSRDRSKAKDEQSEDSDDSAEDDRYSAEQKQWLADNVRLGNLITLYWKKHGFFVTLTGEPGLGPKRLEPGDEIFAVAGSAGLLALRPRRYRRRRTSDEGGESSEDRPKQKRRKAEKSSEEATIPIATGSDNAPVTSMPVPADPEASSETAMPIAATPDLASTSNLQASTEASTIASGPAPPPPKASSSAADEKRQPTEEEGEEAPIEKMVQRKPRYRTSDTSYFTLVGPCYMDGYMEGQAVINSDDDLDWEDLVLY